MVQAYEFITFGEIQQLKKRWWKKNSRGIGFQQAAQILVNSGKVHMDVPNVPDFLSWDLESTEQFRRLTDQIPIPLRELRSEKKEIFDKITFLETVNEVQIGLESVYTEDLFVSVSYFTILYVLSGSCMLHLSDRTIEMRKGELCILPPDIPFYVFTVPGDVVINISSSKVNFEKQFHALLFYDNPLSAFFRHSLMPSILNYMENNYTNLSLENLADQFHYDPAYLSREIKSHTGKNYAEIIANLKLREGCRLLSESNLSIASIAKKCGYHSASHFGSAFKSKYGITASAYRSGKETLPSPETGN